jgi:iron complex transport system substrate-binding protein
LRPAPIINQKSSIINVDEDFSPRRVVSLQPSATITLERLGLLERVVGCTKWCIELCPALAGRAVVMNDSWTAQCEQITQARPDLVIASVPYQLDAVAQILKSGSRLLALAPRSLADIYADIAAIAGVMQAGERGRQVIAAMQSEIEAVRSAAQTATIRPRVHCEEWGKPIIRSQPWVAELVHAAGGEFLGEAGKQGDADAVLRSDPDVLIFAWCGVGDRVPLEKVIEQRGWRQLGAVRAGRAYVIRDELLTTPAPILTAGLRALAHAIHPEIFPPVQGIRGIERVCLNSNRMPVIEEVAREIDSLAASASSLQELMAAIVAHLSKRLPKYNWVGFYLLEGQGAEAVLVLGPFVGAPTPHLRIPLDRGVCGAAASSGETVVVDDVNSDPRYLACSLETKSEIVAPIFAAGKVVGELDIDSHSPAAFTADDRKLVEHCAALVGKYIESAATPA